MRLKSLFCQAILIYFFFDLLVLEVVELWVVDFWCEFDGLGVGNLIFGVFCM